MRWIIAALAALAVLGGSCALSYHFGYGAAADACQTASLRSQRDARAQEAKDEARQMHDRQAAVANLLAAQEADRKKLAADAAQIAKVKVGADCSLGPDSVAILNRARAGQ